MRELGRSLINSATMQQLSFVSPRQSRERNACSRGGQRMLIVMVQFVWLCTLGTITHQGTQQEGGRRRDPRRKQQWKENCDPQGDLGSSRGKRSILEKSECGRSRSGLRFTPGLITQEELLWHQHLHGQRLYGVCSSQGTNPRPWTTRSKRGDTSLAGVWGAYLSAVCCWQHPIKTAQIRSFQWSFIIKTEHRKKFLNSSMKSDNSKQENSSPSLLEQLPHLRNTDTSIPAL